ncbi:hypothetical protein IFM89_029923 [Coptis chinensis]|uniref:Uncharacterized protein n=1 Tax=Coptis chinensis TaxID=261450 RepID=A0A835LK78_9MAGN|nr:hypothetical protein IFM89_029923 [Coptis chinensis]
MISHSPVHHPFFSLYMVLLFVFGVLSYCSSGTDLNLDLASDHSSGRHSLKSNKYGVLEINDDKGVVVSSKIYSPKLFYIEMKFNSEGRLYLADWDDLIVKKLINKREEQSGNMDEIPVLYRL